MERITVLGQKAVKNQNMHSPAVIGDGRFVFTSGITPRDQNGKLVGKGDMTTQIWQTLKNLEDILRAAGSDFSKVLKFTVFVTDLDNYFECRRTAESGHDVAMLAGPASTVVEVSKLAHPDMMIEIEAISLVGDV